MYVDLSRDIMLSLRHGHDISSELETLAQADQQVLASQLDTDAKKKTFWINLYNAYILILLQKNPELYEQRPNFFKQKRFTVAGRELSFELVEHGILRRSKNPLGLGVLPKFFPDSFERKMRVKKVDPRIHFALNCGAKSCPPLAAYDYRTLDQDLETMSRNYLRENTQYNAEEKKLYVPKLLLWFGGDFGFNQTNKIKFLKSYGVVPQNVKGLSLAYLEYDWTLHLHNFTDWLQ
jgi:hypothetical protein